MCKAYTKKGEQCKNIGNPFCKKHINNIEYIPISSFICNLIANKQCNFLGLKLSDALIKTASTRIFSEPEQSIMELPVNSIDSYNSITNIPSIGKFGMGFFSLLYWLTEDYSRYILLSSSTYSEQYTICLVWSTNGLILYTLNYIPIPTKYESTESTGTSISLFCDNYPLSSKNITNIHKHLNRLFNIKSATIYVNGKSINNIESKNNIDIIVTNKEITVSDWAQGISLNTLYTSLLIPSSSTKYIIPKISYLNLKYLKSEIYQSKHPTLCILVNGIAIVTIDLLYLVNDYKYIINLPYNSLLPVSRDDIIYENNSNEIKNLKNQILEIVDYIINNTYDLVPFITLLKNYIKLNTSIVLYKCLLEILEIIENDDSIILIPRSANLLNFIPNLVYYINPNIYKTEKQLAKYLDPISLDNIFKLKKVIILDLQFTTIETCGLANYIFISKDYINKFPNNKWIDNIIISNTDFLLFPIESEYEINIEILTIDDIKNKLTYKFLTKEEYILITNSYIQILEEFYNNQKIQNLLKILKSTWMRKTQILKSFKNIKNKYIEKIVFDSFLNIYKSNDYINKIAEFIVYLNSAIQNIEFNFYYGETQSIWIGTYYYIDTFINENSLVLNSYSIFEEIFENRFLHSKNKDLDLFYNKLESIFHGNLWLNNEEIKISFNIEYANFKKIITNITSSNTILEDYDRKSNLIVIDVNLYKIDILQKLSTMYDLINSEENTNLINSDLTQINILLDHIKYELIIYTISLIPNVIGNNINAFLYIDNIIFLNLNLRYVHQDLITELYNGLLLCNTPEEYYCFIAIMIKIIKFKNREMLSNKKDINGLGKYIVYLIKNVTNLNLIIYKYLYSGEEFDFINKIQNGILLKSYKYYDILNEVQYLHDFIDIYKYKFSCKTLIYYLYTNTITNNYLNDLNNLDNFSDTIKLQIVEIAVNSGTTKPFIDAIITELYQNSLDAIRDNNYRNPRIDFRIGNNYISIKDYVGFDNFIYMLIPFLSSKDPNNINMSGEMGTGFFNVFRQPQSKKVVIKIIYNNILTIISCSPIFNSNIVIDIEYKIDIINTLDDNSTEIIIFLKEDEFLIDLIVDANLFINTYIAINTNKLNIYLNDVLLYNKFEVIYQIKDIGEILYTNDNYQTSYIMTNYVPFLNLDIFCDNFINIYSKLIELSKYGIVINFYKYIYKPTQSRTKIIISDENELKITQFINDGLYIGILNSYINNKSGFESIIKNTDSKCYIKELLFSSYITNENIIYNYVLNGNTLSKYCNSYIFKILKNNNALNLEKDKENIFFKVFKKWVSNKDLKIPPKEPKILKNNVFKKCDFFNIFIIEYWKLLKIHINNNTIKGVSINTEPPIIYIGPIINKNILGYYDPNSHKIILGENTFDDNKLYIELLKCKNSNNYSVEFNINNYLQNLFSPICNTTLLHEIGHSIQQSSHESASHGLTNISINNDIKLEFDDMCVKIYNILINDGLLLNFLNKI